MPPFNQSLQLCLYELHYMQTLASNDVDSCRFTTAELPEDWAVSLTGLQWQQKEGAAGDKVIERRAPGTSCAPVQGWLVTSSDFAPDVTAIWIGTAVPLGTKLLKVISD